MSDDDSLSLLGFLLPGIIHEFKNVLNRIHLLSEHGLQTDAPAETQRQNLKEIITQAKNADSSVIAVLNRLYEALERSRSELFPVRPRQDYASDRTLSADGMYNADVKPKSVPVVAGFESFLRSSEDLAVFFRIVRSSCKRWEVNITTGDLPASQILGCDQTCFLLLIDVCQAVCAIGGAVEVDFPAGEDSKIENKHPKMRISIALPEKSEPELYKKFKSEIERICDRGAMEVGNLDRSYDEDGLVSGQSNHVKLKIRIKLKKTIR